MRRTADLGICRAWVVAAAAIASVGCASVESTHGSQPTRSPSNRDARVAGWVVLSIGIDAAAVAATTSVMMLHQKGVRDDNCDASKSCTQAGINANRQLSNLAGWNAGAWAVAAAGLGVGTFLIVTNPPEEEPQTTITVGPTGSGLGLGVERSF